MAEGQYIVVLMTAPNEDDGAMIGKKVVEEGLVACCNIVPKIRSIYIFKGNPCVEP
ncbi:MAG: divalent-cation tolerance protein CutA [Deltaproteobacteria bacterium]|nr:divalent-cation tolerance protein CutA [Deltaproteobacteria bacterium]